MLSCIRSLRELFSITSNSSDRIQEEFNAVLAIEQMLTTGGGWQVILNTSIIKTSYILLHNCKRVCIVTCRLGPSWRRYPWSQVHYGRCVGLSQVFFTFHLLGWTSKCQNKTIWRDNWCAFLYTDDTLAYQLIQWSSLGCIHGKDQTCCAYPLEYCR